MRHTHVHAWHARVTTPDAPRHQAGELHSALRSWTYQGSASVTLGEWKGRMSQGVGRVNRREDEQCQDT